MQLFQESFQLNDRIRSGDRTVPLLLPFQGVQVPELQIPVMQRFNDKVWGQRRPALGTLDDAEVQHRGPAKQGDGEIRVPDMPG